MVKEGYKETILGTLPKDWRVDLVDECCEILDKHREPLNQKERDEIPGDIPYYGANGIVDYVGEYIFDEKLILLAEDGGHFEEYTDRPIAYIIEGKSWVNNHAHVLKPKDKYHLEWIYYTLVHKNILPYVYGSTRMKLNQKSLKTIPIQIPPLPEQKKIASILSSVDKSIEKTDEVIEETKELKKGLMQELLTKGIGHSEFKDSQFGKIPKSWKIEPLNKIAEVTGGNTPRRSTEEYWGGDIPWLTPSQLTGEIINEIDKTDEYITEKGFKNSSVKLLPVGTVMLTSRATIGETVINKVPMTTNQGFANIICKDDKLFNYFVLYLLRYLTPKLEALAGGSTFLEISRTSVRSLNIPVPPLEEQKKIASILSSVDAKIKKEEEYKEKLERLKKGLMQKLLTGEIRVNTEMEV